MTANHNLTISDKKLQTNADEIMEELTELLRREREITLNLQGEELIKTVKDKAEKIKRLEELVSSGVLKAEDYKQKLLILKTENAVNTRLFRSILKLGAMYRKILIGTELLTGTYAKSGEYENKPACLRFDCSA